MKKRPLMGRSLFIFSPRNKCRRCVRDIVVSKVFEGVILFLIIFSTIMLAVESPLDNPNGLKLDILYYMDIVMTILFSLECVIKIFVLGFIINGKDSYLLNGWNIVDFFIVSISIFSLTFTGVDLKIFKILRMVRVLRPLRMISRNEGLKIAV